MIRRYLIIIFGIVFTISCSKNKFIDLTRLNELDIILQEVPKNTVISKRVELENISESIIWSINDNNLAKIISNKYLLAINKGTVTLTATYGNTSSFVEIEIADFEEVKVDNYLSIPAPNYLFEIPVVIINFLPTADGITIDIPSNTPYGDILELAGKSLNQMKERINTFNKRGKFMLEEGSKYHGYKDGLASPSLGYRVIKSFNIYKQIPLSKTLPWSTTEFYPNYDAIFKKLEIENMVNNLNVKEIWIWYPNTGVEPLIHTPESNMSSPVTGDVSNSYQIQNDLPIYNKTYIVYTHNPGRSQSEMIHNHGHQLESMFKYVSTLQDGNYNLFVSDFSGWGNNYSSLPIGRCGDTHHPPNTTKDYDYLNSTLVESDIEDWRPDGLGNKKFVNVNTWDDIVYNWPGGSLFSGKTESQWYIYWMQNMPGYQNNIPFFSTGKKMTNWWEFVARWDDIINYKGLYE